MIDVKLKNIEDMVEKIWQYKEDNMRVPFNFKNYVFKHPSNKWFIRIAIPVMIAQFVVFKWFYPFAGFINGDSYVYLESAYHNFTVNTYPIGYSKFLRLFSVFTHSDTVLVAFQYTMLQASTLSLVFTIFYLYSPGRLTKILMFSFMIINPVYLYLSNYISSDSIFLSLSLVWFTLLLWIMRWPGNRLIFINALVLFAAFTIRYNALFYPIVGCVALFLTKRRIFMNVVGYCLSLILILTFIQEASHKYKDISGQYQFTPFSGWQMANNALYAYRYIDSSKRLDVPAGLKPLDSVVRNYFDTSRDVRTHPIETALASTVYMWDPRSPLMIYMESRFKNDSTASALKKWAVVGPLMKEYGAFLIRTYPGEFVKYYLVPNVVKYYAPPVEFLNQYSTGVDSVNNIAKVWFGYKSNKLRCNLNDYNVSTLNYYPVLTGTMNVVLLLCMFSFFILGGHREHPDLFKGIILVAGLWGVNFGFSVLASPIALRFQLFPILISMAFTFLLLEFLVKKARQESGKYSIDSVTNMESEGIISN